MDLNKLGWNETLEAKFQEYKAIGFVAGRVFIEHKNIYRVYTESGEILAEISGRMRHDAVEGKDYPSVGDWVIVEPWKNEQKGSIHGILPRKSKFSRKVAGDNTREQILASNVDIVFLVNALNKDFNMRRIERYLVLAFESGASPVIILSKADLCEDIDEKLNEVSKFAMGVPIHVVSSIKSEGVDYLKKYLVEGKTVALLGSSGAGKSTLINELAGCELQRTGDIRDGDDKGKHTTTHRELMILPGGGLIIDTPGMRELQMWDGGQGISETFEDIEQLSKQCKFTDCKHKEEPGCAVNEALAQGNLSEERLQSYIKLQKEILYFIRKQDQVAMLNEKRKWKNINKEIRKRNK